MHSFLIFRWYRILLAVLFAVLFGACNASRPPAATPVPATAGVEAVSATETPAPTETLTPAPTEAAGLVILYAPEGANAELAGRLQPVISELAAGSGLSVETRPSLAPGDLESRTGIVVALPPASNLAELAAAAPRVQFLAVGIPGLSPSENLSLIGPEGLRPDMQGYLAGYLAAVLTRDWRVGVITPSADGAGLAARNGFFNGVVFYCGLCRPAYPPYYTYPVSAEAPPGDGPGAQAAAQSMIDQAVETVYVYPGAGDQAMLDTLAEAGLAIIEGGSPVPSAGDRRVASIGLNLEATVREIWPDLTAGRGGAALPVPLAIEQRNPHLFSPGRQEWVEEFLSDLLSGQIDTGVDPDSGELLQAVPWGN